MLIKFNKGKILFHQSKTHFDEIVYDDTDMWIVE